MAGSGVHVCIVCWQDARRILSLLGSTSVTLHLAIKARLGYFRAGCDKNYKW